LQATIDWFTDRQNRLSQAGAYEGPLVAAAE